jgi:hypothetical protein
MINTVMPYNFIINSTLIKRNNNTTGILPSNIIISIAKNLLKTHFIHRKKLNSLHHNL